MSEIADLEGRVGTLETKVKNQGEDIATLQSELDDLELWLVESTAKAIGMTILDPIDYRVIYSAEEYTIDNIPLFKMPIVKMWFEGGTNAPISAIVSSTLLRKLPNISASILANPMLFDISIDATADCHYESAPSSVIVETISPYITKYTHSVVYEGYNNDATYSYSFLVVTEPSWYEYNTMVENGQPRGLNYLDQSGIYYLDDHSVKRHTLTENSTTLEEEGTYSTLHDRILFFNSPVTIPAQGVTQAKMEKYINETILGGKW